MIRPLVVAIALAIAAGAPASAQDREPERFGYELSLGLEHSDNIARTSGDEIDDTILVPRAVVDLLHRGPRFEATVAADVSYRHYLDGSFDDEVRGRADAVAWWSILPGRLRWLFEDHLAVEPVSLFTRDDPSNLQQINVFTTGPQLELRPSPRTRVEADLRWTDSWAEETREFRGQRTQATLRGELERTPLSTWGLAIEAWDVGFEDEFTSADYRRADVYASYARRLRRFELDAQAGGTRIDFDDGGDTSGPLARVGIAWLIDADQALRLRLRRQFSDATQSLIDVPLLEAPGTGTPIERGVVADVFRERSAELRYERRGRRFAIDAGPFWRDYEYENTPTLDRRSDGAVAEASWALSPRTSLRFAAAGERRDYALDGREDRDIEIALGVERRFTDHWSGRAGVLHRRRDSTAPNQDYDENVVFVTAVWSRPR
ncbi:MAG TPA: hypothetical protein VFL14_09510 [Xanthomonadales bacterium]|nr:hypothetical protein [Xanthomonadales bacterium]